MIVTHFVIRVDEDAKGKVACKLKLQATRASRPTWREYEYVEFALASAHQAVRRGRLRLQRQAKTRPANTLLTGGVA